MILQLSGSLEHLKILRHIYPTLQLGSNRVWKTSIASARLQPRQLDLNLDSGEEEESYNNDTAAIRQKIANLKGEQQENPFLRKVQIKLRRPRFRLHQHCDHRQLQELLHESTFRSAFLSSSVNVSNFACARRRTSCTTANPASRLVASLHFLASCSLEEVMAATVRLLTSGEIVEYDRPSRGILYGWACAQQPVFCVRDVAK